MANDCKCPYCGVEQEINHDGGYGYEEDVKYQQECSHCEKTFVFTTSIHVSHDVYKADCLNGAEHEFEETKTYPKMCAKMRCNVCGDEKPLPEVLFEKYRADYLRTNP